MLQTHKFIAVLCAVCLLLACLAGCASETEEEDIPAAPFDSGTGETAARSTAADDLSDTGVITGMRLDENNALQILREPAKATPMGAPDSWTIFVYLCGSDLESDGGFATDDLLEMIDGSIGSKVQYVVMTGGSLAWQNDFVDETALETYLIEDGEVYRLESWEYAYMNDPDTLFSFLRWGIENYPADKMGVIFWDHGGGSISGVCLDEQFSNDIEAGILEDLSGRNHTLTLPDLSSALSQVFDSMTDQFEFIGFDACLMGTAETAFRMSPYARYLYASQETEPGYGWDYVAISEAIGESGAINGAELGRIICDSFYESCAEVDSEKNATFSCIDLSRMDSLALAFDAFAKNMLSRSEDPASLAAIVQNVNHVEFFGSNNADEGYFNMVDLAGLVRAVSSNRDEADAVLEALGQAVLYVRNGTYHDRACGLSIYYPLHVDAGSGELGQYAQIAFSPYYYGYVAQNAYAAANGSLDGYQAAASLEAWVSTANPDIENIIEDYGGAQVTGESPYVVFCDEPQLFEDGTYGFSLTDDSLPFISTVEADIYYLSDDGEDLVYLGSTDDIDEDWDNGVFLDNFDGLWFCLPDGQLVSAYVVSQADTYAIYTTPVLLNGSPTNLRFVVTYSDYSVTLDGIWDGTDEYGLAGRNTRQLSIGDVIQPQFHATHLADGEDVLYHGEEYIYDGSREWFYAELFDAEYYYQFSIYDIYGDYYSTNSVNFTVADGEIYFYPEE